MQPLNLDSKLTACETPLFFSATRNGYTKRAAKVKDSGNNKTKLIISG